MLRFIRRVAGQRQARRARAHAADFLAQTSRTPEVQRELLLSRIARNADSTFGRDHHFHEIRSVADFRKRVPIRGYEGHEPYIARVREGETTALFGPGTEILMFAMTSGTTATPKTIPVTREALNDYREGWLIWGIMAFDAHHEIIDNGLKPILQLASDWREKVTPSGIPCGAITGLTAQMQNPIVRLVYCMPPSGSRIKDIESKYYVALRLSTYRDVGATIAANPSTILAIARLGDREKETLIRDLRNGTIDKKWQIPEDVTQAIKIRSRWKRKNAAARLEEIVERTGRLLPKDYWPNFQFLANWTGGTMGAYLRSYPEFFGDAPIRDVGLIASEGRMTIPIEDGTASGILDIRHSFFEFIPEDAIHQETPDTLEAHELKEGERYFILPTTAGGLYRYQIHDLVRCTGFHGNAPMLEFLNKGAHFSSLTGEKLSEFHVVKALAETQRSLGLRFNAYILLPTWADTPYYSLLVEDADLPSLEVAGQLADEADRQLSKINFEYENRRETLRLAGVKVRKLPSGAWADFQRRRLAKSGGTVEQYKQPCLLSDLAAIDTFAFVD